MVSLFVSLLAVGVLYAASTIGANIVTTGTLSVTDTSTLTGAVTMSSSLTLGSSGTAHTKFISGNCAGSRPASTFVASSTEEWICTVSGAADDDKVFASLDAPSSGTINSVGFEGLIVTGARATTTGAIGVRVFNGTGAASTSVSTNYTNLNYWIAD